MPSYSIDYERAAYPNAWAWFSVETPSVFCEYKLPIADRLMTAAHKRQWAKLERLAEAHSTRIQSSPYRRG